MSFPYSSPVTGTGNIRDKFVAIGRQMGVIPVLVQHLSGTCEFFPCTYKIGALVWSQQLNGSSNCSKASQSVDASQYHRISLQLPSSFLTLEWSKTIYSTVCEGQGWLHYLLEDSPSFGLPLVVSDVYIVHIYKCTRLLRHGDPVSIIHWNKFCSWSFLSPDAWPCCENGLWSD